MKLLDQVLTMFLISMNFQEIQNVSGAVLPKSNISIISSPRVTDWGEWGDFDVCPENTYVMGMRLKTEPAQGPGDDTALNGVSFMCGVNGDNQKTLHSPERQIQSLVGSWGTWGVSYECPGSYAIGFQLRSESSQKGQDDTAANNVRIFCSSSLKSPGINYLEGSGLSWGSWSDPQFCSNGWAMCGIRTQVESSKGHCEFSFQKFKTSLWLETFMIVYVSLFLIAVDDTSLNNLDAQCCLVS